MRVVMYLRLSSEDRDMQEKGKTESDSIANQDVICKGWFLPPNTYDCGSFVVN